MQRIKALLSDRRVLWSILAVVLGLVVYGIIRVIIRDWDQIAEYPWHINGWWLAGSIILATGSIALSSKVMHRLIKAFGARIGFWKFAYIFWLANMGRYAPGKIIQVVGMLVMLKREGISRRVAISAMVVFQGMLLLVGGMVATVLMGPGFLKKISPAIPEWTVIPFVAVGLILSFPTILERLINLGLKALGRDPYGREQVEYKLSIRDWLIAIMALVILWVGFAASFASLIKAITPLTLQDFPYAGGTFLAAYIVGWLVLITPGGLGVREGIIALLLSAILPGGVAGVVSIVSRPWTLIIDALLLAIIALVYRIFMGGEAVIIRKTPTT